MTKEQKQTLLVDLYSRLPYGVVCRMGGGGFETLEDKLTAIGLFQFVEEGLECVPYLRPMSSMTEEEAKEIATLHDLKKILSVKITDEYIDVIIDDGVCSTERMTLWYDELVSSIECFDLLNKKMFDYRGLIPMGLALEAKEGIYND